MDSQRSLGRMDIEGRVPLYRHSIGAAFLPHASLTHVGDIVDWPRR